MERIESEGNNGNGEMKGGNWQMTEDQRQVELSLQLAEPETERNGFLFLLIFNLYYYF